jgi:hypothetical protein
MKTDPRDKGAIEGAARTLHAAFEFDRPTLVRQLLMARDALCMRDKQFWEAFLPGDYWTWVNARGQGVSDKVLTAYQAVLPEILEEVRKTTAIRNRITTPQPVPDFCHTTSTRLVEDALRGVLSGRPEIIGRKGSKQRRMILVLGVTDSGKSELRDYLAVRYNGTIVRCTESCRSNANAFHKAIQASIGEVRPWGTRAAIEQATFRRLDSDATPRVMLYDESLRLGPTSWNVIADINDHTNCVQILFGLPDLEDRLSGRGFAESSQTHSRFVAVIELGPPTASDIMPLLSRYGLNGSTIKVAEHLADACKDYGRFGLIRRVLGSMDLCRDLSLSRICGDLNKPRSERTSGIIPMERDSIRHQRMTEKLREANARTLRLQTLKRGRRSERAEVAS